MTPKLWEMTFKEITPQGVFSPEIIFRIPAETESEAIVLIEKKYGFNVNAFRGTMTSKSLGFIHPDGKFRVCDVPPEGFKIESYLSIDGIQYLAIPYEKNLGIQAFALGMKMPEGTLFWIRGEWRKTKEP